MTSTYIAQIGDGYRITLEKGVLIKEGLAIGDFVELTVRKIEKTPMSDSGGPYSL
jgi:bifunctional DNA-binding transcriptional regulator/antitoxin component of YhaV-PrlF toxin-antitoxin module